MGINRQPFPVKSIAFSVTFLIESLRFVRLPRIERLRALSLEFLGLSDLCAVIIKELHPVGSQFLKHHRRIKSIHIPLRCGIKVRTNGNAVLRRECIVRDIHLTSSDGHLQRMISVFVRDAVERVLMDLVDGNRKKHIRQLCTILKASFRNNLQIIQIRKVHNNNVVASLERAVRDLIHVF